MKKNILLTIGAIYSMAPIYTQAKDKKQPNIIVIYTDDHRYDAIGNNDNRVINTPNLDKLFSGALRFTNANPAFSLSSPSRAALLTGRYGSANGVLQLDSKLNPGEKTVASYLKENGYITAISGKWHIDQKPNDVGFDYHCYFYSNGAYYNRTIYNMGKIVKPEIHCDSYCADRSVDFLKEHANDDKPFFLFHCTQLPHMDNKHTWDAKQVTKDKYNIDDMPCPENCNDDLSNKPSYLKKVRNLTQAKKYGYPDKKAIQQHALDYYSVITEMDEFLGKVINELKEQNLLENTYIFFMGDNGWMIGEHGFTSKVLPYQASTKVPFFITGPNIKKEINSSFVSNIDIAPTILDIAGIKIPENMHGKSLLPIMKNKKEKVRNNFVYEGLGTYGGSKPVLAVLSDNYRYIVTYKDKTLKEVEFEELYDTDEDNLEMNNLINNKEYIGLIKRLRKDIDNHKLNILGL